MQISSFRAVSAYLHRATQLAVVAVVLHYMRPAQAGQGNLDV